MTEQKPLTEEDFEIVRTGDRDVIIIKPLAKGEYGFHELYQLKQQILQDQEKAKKLDFLASRANCNLTRILFLEDFDKLKKLKELVEEKIKELQKTQKAIRDQLNELDSMQTETTILTDAEKLTYEALEDNLNELASDEQELQSILSESQKK